MSTAEQRDEAARRATDERHMARCLELARQAEGRTAPNPLVGCVIVGPDGAVLAEGYHRRAGEPHAEADALAKLGGRAPDATLYVNLEPCAHRGQRRTEPCAPKVAAAGIRRLVVGMLDPIPSHGGGAAAMAAAGIEVTTGVLADECADLNRGFVTWATMGRPWFTLKAAVTLDGRIATRSGQSQWITGEEARQDGHRLRDRLDAILVGIGTVLADDPRLTARGVDGGRDPVRVVVDGRLRTPPTARLLPGNGASAARTIIATQEDAPGDREADLVAAGAEVWRLPGTGPLVDLVALARELARAELTSVLAEGGPGIHAGLIEHELADELVLYMAPLVFGSLQAPPWVQGEGVDAIHEARAYRLVRPPEVLGRDLKLVYRRA